jgi:2-oxoglutarate ferredoxin oxidoreductase subunit gamma
MINELVFSGFGGQGVLTAGLIFSEMALKEGKEVSWMPAYGPTMRGGKANSVVKFGDEALGSPNMEEIDVLVAMNQPSMEYAEFMKQDGMVFLNSDMIPEDADIRNDVEVIRIPCVSLAQEVKNLKGANLVMVGAVIKKCAFFEKSFAIETLKDYFEEKGKGNYNEANEAAFLAGFDAVK